MASIYMLHIPPTKIFIDLLTAKKKPTRATKKEPTLQKKEVYRETDVRRNGQNQKRIRQKEPKPEKDTTERATGFFVD